jgi:hypothetical protein
VRNAVSPGHARPSGPKLSALSTRRDAFSDSVQISRALRSLSDDPIIRFVCEADAAAVIRQGSEPGGDPPKPPGAAPGPSTAHGMSRLTAEGASGTEAPAPVRDRTLCRGNCPVVSS